MGEHAHMATPFLEHAKIYKKIEFYQIIECDACLGSNPMFFDTRNRFKPSVLPLNHHMTHNRATPT